MALIRLVAARRAMRRTGVNYWRAVATAWANERILGLPAWVLLVGAAVATFLGMLLGSR